MRSVRGSSKAWNAALCKKRKTFSPMKCYVRRNEKLSELGYAGYVEYLKSQDWQRIRDRKLQRYPDCLLCQKRANQVHHLSYDFPTLLGIKHWRLVQLCSDCHKSIEFDGERKRPLKGANAVLFRLAAMTERGRRWAKSMSERGR